MIRDGFENKKEVTGRESQKKRAMGERAFYATQIPKLKDMVKAVNTSGLITFIMLAIAYALVLLMKILGDYEVVRFIIWSVAFGIVAVFEIVWYLILKPNTLKKAERYRQELERLNAGSIEKMAGAYSLYGEKYKEDLIRRHDEEKQKAEKQASEVKENQKTD